MSFIVDDQAPGDLVGQCLTLFGKVNPLGINFVPGLSLKKISSATKK